MEKRAFTKVVKPRFPDGSLHACPCCGRHTLQERGKGEICPRCFWQDDGQDDPFADEVRGGGNGKLSLTHARLNFQQCGAYDPRIGRDEKGGKIIPPKEVSPAPPQPKAPRPTPWWTKLSRRQRNILCIEGIALLVVGLCTYWFASGRLTREMLKDRGYYLWSRGQNQYHPEYLEAFARDRKLQQRFHGQPVDTLHPFFPNLFGAGRIDLALLHETNPGHTFPPTNGKRMQTYWLDSHRWGRVCCVLVLDGEIRDFFVVDR